MSVTSTPRLAALALCLLLMAVNQATASERPTGSTAVHSTTPPTPGRLTPARASGFIRTYPSAYADATGNHPFAYLDWYLNPDGVSALTHCQGHYQQPQVNFPEGLQSAKEQPIYASAGQSRTLANRTTELTGDVTLRKGNRQLRSQKASYSHEVQSARLEGFVQLREPNLLLLGSSADINLGDGTATIEEAEFVVHRSALRGDARSIDRLSNGHVVINQGRYTRCEPGNDSWTLNGRQIILRPDTGLGSVEHGTLRVGDVPVLYVPYLYFPIDDRRMSGLLPPNLAISSTNGLDLGIPYYFNLAPHYDDTLTLRHIEKRGTQLENEFRYLHPVGQFSVSTAWLENDRITDRDRWLFGFDHRGQPADGWRSSIDFTRVSDANYFDDLGTSLEINRDNHLQQTGRISYRNPGFNAMLQAQDFQVIDEDTVEPYAKLPQLTLWGAPQLLNSDRVQLRYLAELTRFDRNPDDFTGNARTTGDRAYMETAISTPFNWPWAFVRPTLKLSHTAYRLANQPAGIDDTATRTQPRFSLDSGLFFERPLSVDDQPFTQTLEPRLMLVEAPFRHQDDLPNFDSGELTFSFNQLFRDDRFSGRDRSGDTRHATLGMTSRLLDPNGSDRFSLSGGQIYYFEDRQVRLQSGDPALTDSRSQFAAEAGWRVNNALRLQADALWSKDFGNNSSRNFKLAYSADIDHQLHLNYRFTQDDLQQLDGSLIWPINPSWSLLARWLQDLDNAEPLDRILGLEYENCCWRVRTVYRSWVDETADQRSNDGLFMQVELKGLGGFGTQTAGNSPSSVNSFMKEITGYEQREEL